MQPKANDQDPREWQGTGSGGLSDRQPLGKVVSSDPDSYDERQHFRLSLMCLGSKTVLPVVKT